MSQRVSARRTTPGSARHHAAAALFALLVLLILALATAALRPARAADPEAATVVANQLRRQGFTCDEPAKAERDVKASIPHEAVWNLRCKNASYRVRLVPNSAAKVETLENR